MNASHSEPSYRFTGLLKYVTIFITGFMGAAFTCLFLVVALDLGTADGQGVLIKVTTLIITHGFAFLSGLVGVGSKVT